MLAFDLAARPSRVKADPGQIEQVVINLAVNARDAMPRGGRLTVGTSYLPPEPGSREAGQVVLSVSDSGCGMDEDTLRQVFEPFFTTKPVGRGTGLGLSTVHGIVEQHGGSIEVDSRVGQGTTFRLRLPHHADQEEEHPPIEPEQKTPVVETVLLVEDDPLVREATARMLCHLGYEVLVAADGERASELIARHQGPVDLLLTDVVMPGISGRELADRLASKYPGLRVLFTSGHTDDAMLRHGVVHSAVQFISKPYSLEALAVRLRQALAAPPALPRPRREP